MTFISPTFPLIGTRDYIHSSTMLTFLEQFQSVSDAPVLIDLKIRRKLFPGGQVLIDGALNPDAAAFARVGKRTISFLNPKKPISTLHQPDVFKKWSVDTLHERDGLTKVMPPIVRDELVSGCNGWSFLVSAAKVHLSRLNLSSPDAKGTSNFVLARITSRKPCTQRPLIVVTKVALSNGWFRLGVFDTDLLVGHVLCKLETMGTS